MQAMRKEFDESKCFNRHMVFLHNYVRLFIAFSIEWAKDRVGNCQDPNSSTSSATQVKVDDL